MTPITTRERQAILRSLASGVVPAMGLQHIQVGRNEEVQAILKDLDHVKEGAAAVRFIIGRFGSGKTFFLSLMRHVALQRKFVVAQADITTDRRLHRNDGHVRTLHGIDPKLINAIKTRWWSTRESHRTMDRGYRSLDSSRRRQ